MSIRFESVSNILKETYPVDHIKYKNYNIQNSCQTVETKKSNYH